MKFAAQKKFLTLEAFIFGYVAYGLWIATKWTVDDAYIIFRYAKNLVEAQKFTYNVGEDPVEGYTGVLLPVLIALGMRFNFNPVNLSQTIGVCSYLILIITFYKASLKISAQSKALSLVFLTCFIVMGIFYTHAYSGLETTLYSALLILSFLQIFNIYQQKSTLHDHSLLAMTLLFLSLTRPEGAFFSLIIAFIISISIILKEKKIKFGLIYLLIFALPGGIYFIWRFRYYGYFLPNTFYVKSDSGFSWDSFFSLSEFIYKYFLCLIIALILAVALTEKYYTRILMEGRAEYLHRKYLYSFGITILSTLIIIGFYLNSNLTMNYSYRFFAPYTFLFLLMLLWASLPFLKVLPLLRSEDPKRYFLIKIIPPIFLIGHILYQINNYHQNEITFMRKEQVTDLRHYSGQKFLLKD